MDGRDGVSHESRFSIITRDRKEFHNALKKSNSLYEARNKHKNERARFYKTKKSSDVNDDDKDIANIPKLNPTKSSPVNENNRGMNDDNDFSLPSYRQDDGNNRPKEEQFETNDNWEVSRIEKRSDLEKSFKKKMRGILPEEHKCYGYEVEKRLIGLDPDDEDIFLVRPGTDNNKVKKVPASPASDDYSMITSNQNTSNMT